jgi:hypothetical protein
MDTRKIAKYYNLVCKQSVAEHKEIMRQVRNRQIVILKFILFAWSSLLFLSACQPVIPEPPTNSLDLMETPSQIQTDQPFNTISPIPILTTISSTQRISTETPVLSPTEIRDPTESPSMVFARPEGTVLLQASCRYGPGAAYLYEWGLYPGDFVWILNRNEDGSWVYVKPITYNNECWVKAELLQVRGDIGSLEEYYSPLPQGYLYKPIHYVVAIRKGDEVEIAWEPVWMTEDDDRGYLIEAWVCQNGKFIFLPINYFPYTKTFAVIVDEPGCSETSHARIYTVEKHGYLPWVPILWPAFSGKRMTK